MKNITLLLLLSTLTQCAKTELALTDYFVFGRYENLCTKDCSNFVKYESNNLYYDNVRVLSEDITFNTSSLPLDNLSDVKALKNSITNYMNNNVGDIGCPNCDGKGAYYIETRINGTVRKWRIDDDRSKISDIETKAFLDQTVALCAKFSL